jgi:hypothetical protein
MSSSNLDFVRKADYEVSTVTPGGYLLPKQAEEYVELNIKESDLLGRVDTTMLDRQSFEVDQIGFTGQVLHPAEENTALGVNDRSVAEHDKVTFMTKALKAEVRISYQMLQTVLKRGQFIPYILKLLQKAAKRDLEDLLISGDTALDLSTSRNRLLRKVDGIMKLASAHVFDAEGQRTNANPLDDMRRQMPTEYYKNDAMQFFTSKNAVIDYERSISARSTGLGDDQYQSKNKTKHHGIPVVDIPVWPENLTYNALASHTNILLADPSNIVVAFLDEMMVRTGEDISAGQYIAVIYFQVDVKFRNNRGVVKAINVRV